MLSIRKDVNIDLETSRQNILILMSMTFWYWFPTWQRSEQFLTETFGPRFLPGGRSFHSSHLMERIGMTDAVNRGHKTKSGKDFVHTGCGSKWRETFLALPSADAVLNSASREQRFFNSSASFSSMDVASPEGDGPRTPHPIETFSYQIFHGVAVAFCFLWTLFRIQINTDQTYYSITIFTFPSWILLQSHTFTHYTLIFTWSSQLFITFRYSQVSVQLSSFQPITILH